MGICLIFVDNGSPPVAEVVRASSMEFIHCRQGAEHNQRVPKQGHRMDVAVPD